MGWGEREATSSSTSRAESLGEPRTFRNGEDFTLVRNFRGQPAPGSENGAGARRSQSVGDGIALEKETYLTAKARRSKRVRHDCVEQWG